MSEDWGLKEEATYLMIDSTISKSITWQMNVNIQSERDVIFLGEESDDSFRIYLNTNKELVKSNIQKQGFEPLASNVEKFLVTKSDGRFNLFLSFSSGKSFQREWRVEYGEKIER
ncbi:MAG: hypothetical protein LBD38_01740 [Streptococcaceae bacterium]|nr:hypothetical protein [Streptococcaceae bacterium]